MQIRKLLLQLFVLCSIFVLASVGCSGKNSSEPTATAEVIVQPSPTPKPDRVVLIAGSGADADTLAEASMVVGELAVGSGLEFEQREQLETNELTSDIRIAIFLSHPDNLGSLANAAPQTQFIAISDRDWTPVSNVTIIRVRPENQVFLAGYITALLPDNYRAGGLLPSGNDQENTAFRNGVFYYCGLCQSNVYPLNRYPALITVGAGSPPVAWVAGFEEINLNTVKALYITPDAYSSELFGYLINYNIPLIGISKPPSEVTPFWAATVLSDSIVVVRQIWDQILEGQGGRVLNAGLKMVDVNAEIFSQGKQLYVQDLINLLQAGEVYALDIAVE